ncbi:MAG TPA: pentapeptide repeat-containing protein [Streptosporangiaceae bacterium]|nr:pentapeptide repeat-containing protein [Streptosporangiaceae bacterium]
MSAEAVRAERRADPRAVEVLDDYRAARARGEYRLLKLAGADLRDTDLSELDLDECDLTGATLDGARLISASLVRARLAGASLLGADLSYANMDRADMDAVGATAATFMGATLRRAQLNHSQLQRADFSDADLSRASLFESNLRGANLSRAVAEQADLRGAALEDAILTGLHGEPVFHIDPSLASPETRFGWPATRLAETQLVELAESYLSTQGWGLIEHPAWREEGADLIARRGDEVVFLQVKATATPSARTFAHLAERLNRAADEHANVNVILVVPGPIPESLRIQAAANRIGILSILVQQNGLVVEEVGGNPDRPLRTWV